MHEFLVVERAGWAIRGYSRHLPQVSDGNLQVLRQEGLLESLALPVPPAGFEPAPLPPEGSALSPELRGPGTS
jgi:hypothetical protein